MRAQILRHAHHLGVLAVANQAVADRKASDAAADLGQHADVAVTQRQRLIQLALHRLQCAGQAIGAHLVQHQAHLVRLLARLIQPVGVAELDQHAFGACRDQRGGGVD